MARLGFFALFVAAKGAEDMLGTDNLLILCQTFSPIASDFAKEHIADLGLHVNGSVGFAELFSALCNAFADDNFSDDDKTALQKSIFQVIEGLGVEFISDEKIMGLSVKSKEKLKEFFESHKIALNESGEWDAANTIADFTSLIDQLPEVESNASLKMFLPILHVVAGKNLKPSCENRQFAETAANGIAKAITIVWEKFQKKKKSDGTAPNELLATLLPKIASNILTKKVTNFICPTKEVAELAKTQEANAQAVNENAKKDAELAKTQEENEKMKAELAALKAQNAKQAGAATPTGAAAPGADAPAPAHVEQKAEPVTANGGARLI